MNALEPTSAIWPLFPPQPEGVQISSPSLSSTIQPDGTIDDCRLLYERLDELALRTEFSVFDSCTGVEGILYTIPEPIYTFPGFINGDREFLFQWEHSRMTSRGSTFSASPLRMIASHRGKSSCTSCPTPSTLTP